MSERCPVCVKRIACLIAGHKWNTVVASARDGMLPGFDGFVAHKPHPKSRRIVCQRCRSAS